MRGGEQYDINLAYIDIVVLVLLWSFCFVSTVVDMASRHLTMGLTAMCESVTGGDSGANSSENAWHKDPGARVITPPSEWMYAS